jgi:hypothetical protein
LWQRDVHQHQHYQVTPSLPYSVLNAGFAPFMKSMCERFACAMPDDSVLDNLLAAGQQRWQQVQRLQLVRHGFRRALELWLVLDRALYLAEHRYDVQLYQFCERTLTPRNLLIDARQESY